VLNLLLVGVWFTLLSIVLVLLYFYRRDRRARKKKVEEKNAPSTEKRDSGKSYTIVIKQDGSVQVMFGDGKAGESPPSGRLGVSAYRGTGKAFADKNQMLKVLGGVITHDLPQLIPEEKGTYALILHVWKNELTPMDAFLDATGKKCEFCGTLNDTDASYCKKCGDQLR